MSPGATVTLVGDRLILGPQQLVFLQGGWLPLRLLECRLGPEGAVVGPGMGWAGLGWGTGTWEVLEDLLSGPGRGLQWCGRWILGALRGQVEGLGSGGHASDCQAQEGV